jgi:hypothetical protein
MVLDKLLCQRLTDNLVLGLGFPVPMAFENVGLPVRSFVPFKKGKKPLGGGHLKKSPPDFLA